MSMGFVKSAYIKEIFGGNKMFKKLKDKKGFTLVELIVVLVILAILAALLIPALTGYIDKANEEKVVSETRMVVMAAQTEGSEAYSTLTAGGKTPTAAEIEAEVAKNGKELLDLAEVSGNFTILYNEDASVKSVAYTNAGYTCVYANKSYETAKVGKGGIKIGETTYADQTAKNVGTTAIGATK